MIRKKWFIGGIAVLLFIVMAVYFFFPSSEPSNASKEKEIKVSFLEVDSHWADSIIKTLSMEDKASMLILYYPKLDLPVDSIAAQFKNNSPGGFLFSAQQINNYENEINISKSLLFSHYTQLPITNKVKFKTPEENPLFSSPEIFFSVQDDSLLRESNQLMVDAVDFHSVDGVILPRFKTEEIDFESKVYKVNKGLFLSRLDTLTRHLSQNNILAASGYIQGTYDLTKDTSKKRENVILPYSEIVNAGVPILFVDSTLNTKNLKQNDLTDYLKENFKFRGLIISNFSSINCQNQDAILKSLIAGSDLIMSHNFNILKLNILSLIRSGKISEKQVNAKIKKMLLAKTWTNQRRKKMNYEPKESFNYYEQSFSRRFRKSAITLIKNEKNHIPVTNVSDNKIAYIHIGEKVKNFLSPVYKYLPSKQVIPTKNISSINEIKNLNPNDYKRYNTVILTINEKIKESKILDEKLKALSTFTKLIVVNFKYQENLSLLNNFATVIHCWDDSFIEIDYSAQAIFGALKMNAIIPIEKDKDLKGKKFTQCRLQYTIPEEIGISSDSLRKIEYIVNEGIRNRAFPAAQVFFALEGKVFYNKSFGTPTYTNRTEVKTSDLFDMASVTKVAASTIVAMDTYEKGYYQLNDSLYKHIPDTLKKHIHGKSTLRNITFRQILIHATGLAAGQPIIKYIRYRDSLLDKKGRFDKYYCDYNDDYYTIKVADEFFMEKEQEDTIWYAMNRMYVDENPSYRYSDANMNLLFKLLNAKIKHRWKYFLDSLYYKPLGMFNSYYTPLEFDIEPERIIPTENDRYWRKQLLQGYVHDPTAALFGGVAGNAGLFSTAEDIGILFQMLMYKGSYGGRKYFNKETVDLFINKQPDSHRGLGFNRQVKGNTYGVSPYASKNTFGHTGFTGISVWADMDIHLLYVSCTNRVHPDAENKKIIQLGTTKRIHNVIYEQLKYVIPSKINLEKY